MSVTPYELSLLRRSYHNPISDPLMMSRNLPSWNDWMTYRDCCYPTDWTTTRNVPSPMGLNVPYYGRVGDIPTMVPRSLPIAELEKEYEDLTTQQEVRPLMQFEDVWSSRHHLQDPMFQQMTSRDLMLPYFNRKHDLITKGIRNKKIVEMEKRYDEIVRNCDPRFSGIFGVLDDTVFGRQPVSIEHEGRSGVLQKTQDFSLKIDVQDFNPEEIKVKVQGGQLILHAKRENKNEVEGMYAYCCREFKRTFNLPQGVNVEKLTSSVSNKGILKIDAPAVGITEGRKGVSLGMK